ncbi:MAG: DUF2232 domain-containing protein [Alphaproteobacteria bacterium]|nr:DUF2232 domain-containing protein [Alphaproteobacteria bacterium]
MTKPAIIALLAGGLSGLLHLALLAGSAGGVILAWLSPLPLFAAGLWLGWQAAALAGLVATLLIGLGFGPLAGLWFGLIQWLPVAGLTRLALLAREESGTAEWYPLGRLYAWLAGYVGLGLVGMALYFSGSEGGLEGQLTAVIERATRQVLAMMPGSAEQAPRAAAMAAWVPLGFALSWSAMQALNAFLAQGLLARFGRAVRPAWGFSDFALPRWMAPALGAAALLMLLEGTVGLVGRTLAGYLIVGYALAGLAALHALSHRLGDRRKFALIALYVLLAVVGMPIALAVALFGLLEQWFGWRARMASGPPALPPGAGG